jgi:DNA-binding beta-propeller fold protein YncE
MAVDVKGQQLFVAALGNNTVEVIDLREGKRVRSITGLHEPQGVGFVPDLNKLFVANAKSGACDIFDGASLKLLKSVKFSDDADNVRYDATERRVYVGYGSGGIGIIDAATGAHLGDIKLDGHPESFQLEKSVRRIFVNVPTLQKVAVVDREKRAVIAAWPVTEAGANFPMALDEEHHRLFVGARKPAKLIVFDTESGRPSPTSTSPETPTIFSTTPRAGRSTFPEGRELSESSARMTRIIIRWSVKSPLPQEPAPLSSSPNSTGSIWPSRTGENKRRRFAFTSRSRK